MALVINDRVKETSTTSGTGTLNLAGAVTGFVTFVAGIGDTNTTYYAIFEQGTANWEVGIGTVGDATPDTLARTTVITNSLGNTDKISFGGATADVFCTLPASKAVYLDASGDPVGAIANVVEDTTPQLGGNLDVNGQDIVSTSDADIDIIPNGTGDVVLGADTVKVGDAAAAVSLTSNGAGILTVTTGGTTDLILSTNSGTNSGTITITDGANEAMTLTPNGTGVVAIEGSMNPSVSSTGKALVMGF